LLGSESRGQLIGRVLDLPPLVSQWGALSLRSKILPEPWRGGLASNLINFGTLNAAIRLARKSRTSIFVQQYAIA
jgi:hypothetical protein